MIKIYLSILKLKKIYKKFIKLTSMMLQEKIEKSVNRPSIPDHLCRIIGDSGSGQTFALLNSINHLHDIYNIYLYAKDLQKAKCQLLIKKHESVASKHFNNSKVYIEYLNDRDDIYENIDEYSPNKNEKMLISKILNPIVTELFIIRDRKLNIFDFAIPNKQIKFYTLFYYENSKQS